MSNSWFLRHSFYKLMDQPNNLSEQTKFVSFRANPIADFLATYFAFAISVWLNEQYS